MLMEPLEDRRVLATILWDGGAGTTNWQDPANWFDATNQIDNVLPTADDDVEIRAEFAGETIQIVNTIVTVNSLQNAAGLHIQSGHSGSAGTALNLLSDSRFDGPVSFVSGYLGAQGTLTVADTLSWSGGTLRDDGTLVIAAGATLALNSPGSTSDSRTIDNHGTIVWNSGSLSASDPLTINNRTEGLFDIRAGDRLAGSGSVLNNEGTLRKSAGTGRSAIDMRLNNTGTVEVESGTLAFTRRGSSTGSFSYDAGTTLEFRAEHLQPFTMTLESTSSLVGEGRLLVAQNDLVIEGSGQMDVAIVEILGAFGRLRLNRDASVPQVLFSGGVLGGTGTLTVTDSMDWTAGSMADGGTLRIAEEATLTIEAAGNSVGMTTGGHTIENLGTIALVKGSISAGGSSRLTVDNRAGALFDIRTDGGVANTGSTFNNAGTLRKSAGTGRSDVAMRLNNSGLVQVERGTLAFTRSGSSSGSFLFDAGATLELDGQFQNPHTLALAPTSSLTGQGRLLIAGDDIVIENPDQKARVDIQTLEVSGGRLHLNFDTSIATVLVSGGDLGGTGTLTVTESMQWSGGQMGGGGITVVDDGAILTVDATSVNIRGDFSTIKGRTIDNHGTINWIRGNIGAGDPLTLRNRPGALFDIQTDSSFGNNVSGRNFINEGTLRKSAGAGTSSFAMRLNNTAKGTVQVDTGTLALSQTLVQGASSSGRIIGDGRLVIGTELSVEGGLIEIDTVQISVGSGRGSLTGKMLVKGDVSIPRLVFLRGELGGTGTLTVTERVDWLGGNMADGAAWVIDSAATLDIDAGSVGITAGARTIDNHGTVNWRRGTVNVSTPIAFNNHPGATFEIGSGVTWGHTVGTLRNWGTLRAIPGSGTTTMVINVENEGLIDVGSETLRLTRGFIQTAGMTQLAGGTLITDAGLRLRDGALSGQGTVDGDVTQSGGRISPGLAAGLLSIDGDYTVTGGELLVEIAGPPTDGDGNDLAGTNYDRLHVTGDALLGGHLQIDVVDGFNLVRDDVYDIVTVNGLDGSFLSTNADEVGVSVLVAAQAVQLEVVGDSLPTTLHDELNAGITELRNSLGNWSSQFNVNMPAADALDTSFDLQAVLAQAAPDVLPLIPPLGDSPSLVELQAAIESVGYSVDCPPGSDLCSDTAIQLSRAHSASALTGAFIFNDATTAQMSNLPPGVDFDALDGDQTLDGLLELSLALGVDETGFYFDGSSSVMLEVSGDAAIVTETSLHGGSWELHLGGTVSFDPDAPLQVQVAPSDRSLRYRSDTFSGNASAFLTTDAAGDIQIAVTHTTSPVMLSYDGLWQMATTSDESGFTIREDFADVSFPTVDEWFDAALGELTSGVDELLGGAVTSRFEGLQLPLIGPDGPTTAAPSLVGINTATESAGGNWFEPILDLYRGVLRLRGEDGQGLFATQGDSILKAAQLRHDRSVDGTGVRVGVLSTGFDGLLAAQATGDIPLGVLQFEAEGQAGGRGTAMLEVVHDLAPGATLSAASATDKESLINAIRWLVEFQQVDVIVSDLHDYTEPVFSTGPVASLVQSYVDDPALDVLFVQAAGNDQQKSYRGTLNLLETTVSDETEPRTLHRFGGTDQQPLTTVSLELPLRSSSRLVLQTSQPFTAPTADIRVLAINTLGELISPQGLVSMRRPELQDLKGRAIDVVELRNHSDTIQVIELAIEHVAGALPTAGATDFHLVALGNGVLAETQGSALLGLSQLDEVLVTGAVSTADSSAATDFTSGGDAERLVDVLATSDVQVSGFGLGLSNFSGTSAAAAHAGAIAALLRQLNADGTSQQIVEALKQSAERLPGGENPRTGSGRIDALAAAEVLDPGGGSGTTPGDGDTADPAAQLREFFENLPHVTLGLPTAQQLSQLLLGVDPGSELLHVQIQNNGEDYARFEHEWPFDLDGIGSFDQFDIFGKVGLEIQPLFNLRFGLDAHGFFVDPGSSLALDLKGIGEASGVAFDVFGLGAGAVVTAEPYLDITGIDADTDGKIRRAEIQALGEPGNLDRLQLKLDTVDANLHGDVILGFLDYIDIDRELPNRPNGGDPFIVRGKARLELDFTGDELAWGFSDFEVANPDIDGDGQLDYTMTAFVQNTIQFGQSLINGVGLPDYLRDLLGQFGPDSDPRRGEPLERPRGMLPERIEDTADAVQARAQINGHVATAAASGSELDREAIKQELVVWLEGDDTEAGASSDGAGEGETEDEPLSVLQRLAQLQPDVARPIVDDPATPEDEFEQSLIRAIGDWMEWKSTMALAGFKTDEVATPENLELLNTRLTHALRHAIDKAHRDAIQLFLDDAPLNHVYQDNNGTPQLVQRGVIDRAVEAVSWAQTAEYLELATSDNGLRIVDVLDQLVVRVVVESAELKIDTEDGLIGPDDEALLEVKAGWQIKLPPAGEAPDIDQVQSYSFGPTMYDADNIVLTAAASDNNNIVAGDKIVFDLDPLTGLPRGVDLLPITRGTTGSDGFYRTAVRLGQGDTNAQVQIDVGLPAFGMVNTTTNTIQGRPSIKLLGALGDEDDSALRKENLVVTSDDLVAVRAAIRRGNGPLSDASLNFFVIGGGSLDQVEVSTSRHIPRTATDGTATVFYTPPSDANEPARIYVSYFEGGRQYQDSLEVVAVTDSASAALLGQTKNPVHDVPPSDQAGTTHAELGAALELSGGEITDEVRDGLAPFVATWFNESVHPRVEAAEADATAALADPSNSALYEDAEQQVLAAARDFLDWLAFVEMLGVTIDQETVDQESAEATLISSLESLAEHRLQAFDGSAEAGGLTPLYDALSWATNVETLLALNPSLATADTLHAEKVLELSGVAIEFLSGTSLTGETDNATLAVAARVVRQVGNQTVPVMQTADLPAPVEVRVLPFGLATVDDQKGFTGSRIQPETASNQIGLVSAGPFTTTAHRAAGEQEVKLNVGVGIPGILLDNRVLSLRDAPQLDLRGALISEDVDALRKNLVMPAGGEALLQFELTRNGLPVRHADIEFTLIGGGSLSDFEADTGSVGAILIDFRPPVTPPTPGESSGASLVSVSYVEDGVTYTDSVVIFFQYDATGEDGEPLQKTPDSIRALNELEQALRAATTTDPETNLPVIDSDQLQVGALTVLHDWWHDEPTDPVDTNGTPTGSVIYWLEQIQEDRSPPVDTAWNEAPAERDREFREALDAAMANWRQWQAVAAQLDISSDTLVAPGSPLVSETGDQSWQAARQLVAGALQHAVDRVNLRCQIRAEEHLAAPDDTPEEQQQKRELLARLVEEGDKALEYFQTGQLLKVFDDLDVFEQALFEDFRSQFCYQVEIVEEETFLSGTPQNAQLQVKAGIRVQGVSEVLFPPLAINVRPLGASTVDGNGIGRTSDDGVFTAQLTIGQGQQLLQADVDVVFGFEHFNAKAKRTTETLTYTTHRVTLDSTPQLDIKGALEREGIGTLSDQPRDAVDGERVLVEVQLTKGRTGVLGKAVYVQLLGEGTIDDGLHVTDSSGRVRLYYKPPAGKIGQAQIAVAYREGGVNFTESIGIPYTTASGSTHIGTAFSAAQTIATAQAAQHLTTASLGAVLGGGDPDIDFDLLESIQRQWLNSGLTSAGDIDPDVVCGLRCRIEQATAESASSVAREYLRWKNVTAQLNVDERFDETVPGSDEFQLRQNVVDLLKDALDSKINDALDQQSALVAQAALAIAADAEATDFFASEPDYSLGSVLERLGYEIRIDEARLHGQADNAWVQAVVRVYLNTPDFDPDTDPPGAAKRRAAEDTPIQVEVIPLGFSLINNTKVVTNGLYGASAKMVGGDTELQLAIRASDEYADTDVVVVREPGRFSLGAGARRADAPQAALAGEISLFAGQQARVEGIVQKGLGRVRHRDVLATVEGAPAGSIVRIADTRDAFLFTPPEGQSGTATIALTLMADGQLHQETVTVEFSDQLPPNGEHTPEHVPAAASTGLLGHSETVGAFNRLDVPLAADDEDAKLGNSFGLDGIQLPFAGGNLPSSGELAGGFANWFSNAFDLLHVADLDTLIGWLNGGLPAQPEELIRLKLDLENVTSALPPTLLAADFSGVLPAGFEGSVRMDRPELSGQIVFGVDTSSSPFYVLTRPDSLISKTNDLASFFGEEEQERQPTHVGAEATALNALFGVAATFNSSEPLIDGLLDVPHAEGYLSSKVAVDFQHVAAQTGKLRFHELEELANLRVGFDGVPIDTFQAILDARLTVPGLESDPAEQPEDDDGLQIVNDDGTLNLLGAIYKQPGETAPLQFELRTGGGYTLPADLLDAIATQTVEEDDIFDRDGQSNDAHTEVGESSPANFGALTGRMVVDGLRLSDQADWFRFETVETGHAGSFVQVNFSQQRGDLDLALFRLDGDELVHVRTDGLAFGDSARVSLLGQPAGTYFVQVFDDAGAKNPYYVLTIDPPGGLEPGFQATLDGFALRDVAFAVNLDAAGNFDAQAQGRLLIDALGIPTEIAFGGNLLHEDNQLKLRATVGTQIGGRSVVTLNMVPPSRPTFAARISSNGGYLIFDYEDADHFKFAGLNSQLNRWEIGFHDTDGWHVPTDVATAVASAGDLPEDQLTSMRLLLDGDAATLQVLNSESGEFETKVERSFTETVSDGRLGLGTRHQKTTFDNVELFARVPASGEEPQLVFRDRFTSGPHRAWDLAFREDDPSDDVTAAGLWHVNDDGQFATDPSGLRLGDDWLLVDSATLRGTLEIDFNDEDILGPPESITAAIELSNLNALLVVDEGGTPLYPGDPDSPRGMVAIRDGQATLDGGGLRMTAASASAGLQDIIFFTIENPTIDLTGDLDVPLLSAGNIEVLIPALSDDEDFVTISGNVPGEPLLGLSKPTLDDPIPEFLFFDDAITIDFNTELIQQKIDVEGIFPFTLQRIGLRFNDAGDVSGQIRNLADFDLLVSGQIDFENSIFDDLPFEPIFGIGQPEASGTAGRQHRVSDPDAYQDECDAELDTIQFPGFPPLCMNGFVSAELHLGALLGDQPEMLIRELGPFYLGFQELSLFGDDDEVDGSLTINGLVRLGGFSEGVFVPEIAGSLAVVGQGRPGDPPEGTTLGSLTVSGQFITPVLVDDKGTPSPLDDEFESKLILDWIGEASGTIGERFNVSVENAAVNIHTEFTNRFSAVEPFRLSAVIEPRVIDTGNLCFDFGAYVELCGSGVFNPGAGDDEPLIAIREGKLQLGDELGPLSGTSIQAGGFGIGRDGTLYVLPAGYQITDPNDPDVVLAEFPDGAFIEIADDQPGGLFGFPDWVPVSIRGLGLQFEGVADPDDPNAAVSPLTVGPPTGAELQDIAGDAPRGIANLGNRVIDDVIPLTDPENLRLIISGGLEGNEMFPVTGNFERMKVHLGKLAGCVAVAAQNVGLDLVNSHAGYLFDSSCEFPIEGLDGFVIGIEPIDLGPLRVGGSLGLGVFTFDRPIDPDDPDSATEPQNVFYGKIEGEFAAAKIGLGVELIITQYGPVLGRLMAGVPIPIGTLVGSLGGPVGAAFGTGSGFLITGLEGGLVFDSDPLPVVKEPTDIFTTQKLRTPLKITTADIKNAVRDLALRNPTFSELIAAATHPDNLLLFGDNQTLNETFVDILQGRVPGLPVRFTWDDGFRAVVSGTLTNQYVSAQLGLGVTLGANVGYDFEALLPDRDNPDAALPDPLPPGFPVHPNGAPAMNAQGYALDADGNRIDEEGYSLDADGNRIDEEGNPLEDGISGALATFGDAFGFQLYGFADLEVFGFKLVGAGLMMDFSDPINPAFNVAAGLPAAPSLLSLLLPAQGVIGAQLDFDGYLEGSILATLAFLESVRGDTSGFFHDVMTSIGAQSTLDLPSPLSNLAQILEADRRHALGFDLGDPNDANYDTRFDPNLTGYDPAGPFNGTPDLWRQVLDIDDSGEVETGEHREITRAYLVDRILGDDQVSPPISSILPNPLTADFGQLDLVSLNRVVAAFVQELFIFAPTLLQDDAAAESLTADIPFWAGIEAQMLAVHQTLRVTIDDQEQREALDDAFQRNLRHARVIAAFSYRIAEAIYNGTASAADKFAEVVNPSVRITGQLSPMFFGIPMGPPSQSVDVTLSKHELTMRGEFSSLSLLLNTNGLPAFVNDRSAIDVHFPFENLLRDIYRLQLPVINPLADDWRVAMATSLSVLGLEIQRTEGLLFPAGANELLLGTDDQPGKLQLYYGPEHAGTQYDDVYQAQGGIEPDRILVRTSLVDPGGPVDHVSRLLDQGGFLYDGRLTLPRLITDPLQLWEDLQNDEEFQQQIAAFTTDCDDLWSCIAEHPTETFGLLSRVPQIIGEATTLDEVSQVQLFVPNFVDDVIASFDDEALAELQSLLDPAEGHSSDDLAAFLQERVTAALATSGNVLQDAYLVGSYGQWPEPFDGEPFTSTLPNPDDPAAAPPFPTTSKIFGIELGSGRFSGEVTETGFDLDLVGKFLGLADVRFEVEVNTAANPFIPPAEEGTQQNTLFRAGAELVLGSPPEACTISPSAWQGAEDAEQVADQILSFLAHVGLSDEIDEATGTIGEAFEWLKLDTLDTELGACFRAFSPGFDPDSSDPLRRSGGIDAYTHLVIDKLVDADFEFQVRPSSVYPLIPNVIARGTASQVLLPGLEGLSPSGDADPTLGSELEISFVHEDGILSSSLGGTIVLLGHEFSLSGDTTLEIHSDGISGAIALEGSGPFGIRGLYSIGGDFTLAFDTRPGSAFASIMVENGTLELPGFALSDATFSIRVDRNGLHVDEINGRNGLFGDLVTLDFDDSSFSISPELQISDVDISAQGHVDVTVGPGEVHGEVVLQVEQGLGVHGTFAGWGEIFGTRYGDEHDPIVAGTFNASGCVELTSPVLATFELPGPDAACGVAQGATMQLNMGEVRLDQVVLGSEHVTMLEGDPDGNGDDLIPLHIDVDLVKLLEGDVDHFTAHVSWDVVNDGADGGDYILPSGQQILTFDHETTRQTITIEIVRDRVAEALEESFSIILGSVDIAQGDVQIFVGRDTATITLLNDDPPDLSHLNPPLDTILFYNFDRETPSGISFSSSPVDATSPGIFFDPDPVDDLAVVAPKADRFTGTAMQHRTSAIRSTPGLPTALYQEGLVGQVDSRAASGSRSNFTFGRLFGGQLGSNSILQPAYFEFTLDRHPDESIGYKITGIDFWARSSRADQPNWQLLFDANGFAEPIASSSDPATSAEQDPRVPGWTRYKRPMSLPGDLVCTESPVAFRLAHSSPPGSAWAIDNLAIRGEEVVGGCAGELDTSIDEIEAFLDQQEGLLPGGFEISGPGEVGVRIIPEPGSVDPDPRKVVAIDVTGTDPSSTVITMTDNGANPPAANVAPIHITTDSGVFMVDLSAADIFRGSLNIGGPVSDAIYTNGLTDGSSIFVNGQAGDQLEIYGAGQFGTPGGSGVAVTFGGELTDLALASGWFGGSIDVGSHGEAAFGGDFTASVSIDSGFGSFDVIGGDFASPSFESGGPGGAITATAVDGVGGNITGVIAIDGDLGTITATGGSIDENLQLSADNVSLLLASADPATGAGGDVGGEANVGSVDQVMSYDGNITLNLTTNNPLHQDLKVDAVSRDGTGRIDSRNSFHIAGGVARISGNEIRLRIEAGGEIGSIIAMPNSSGRPALLEGDFTAGRFGRIQVGDGNADVTLTATDEAWQLAGQPAIARIDLTNSQWLAGGIRIARGTNLGRLTSGGHAANPSTDQHARLPGFELVSSSDGPLTSFEVLATPWRNTAWPEDVNNDRVVSPIDVLLIINQLNQSSLRVLPTPQRPPSGYVDVSGDGLVSPLDVLLVINHLNQWTASEGEGTPGGWASARAGEESTASDGASIAVTSQSYPTHLTPPGTIERAQRDHQRLPLDAWQNLAPEPRVSSLLPTQAPLPLETIGTLADLWSFRTENELDEPRRRKAQPGLAEGLLQADWESTLETIALDVAAAFARSITTR